MINEKGTIPEKSQLNIRVDEDGDVYIISGLDQEKLLDLAIKISEELEGLPLMKKDREYLQSGNELRPQGCFAVRINARSELCIDNRNGRGYKPATEELKRAVEAATK